MKMPKHEYTTEFKELAVKLVQGGSDCRKPAYPAMANVETILERFFIHRESVQIVTFLT